MSGRGKHRSRGFRSWLRSVPGWGSVSALCGVLACALIAAGLSPVNASSAVAADTVAGLRAGTLRAGVDAAAALAKQTPVMVPVVDEDQGPKKDTGPVGSGQLKAGKPVDVTADPVGAKLAFSGHSIDRDLDVKVQVLAPGAARVAAAETAGVVLASPVAVTAVDSSGTGVTSFPADPTIVKPGKGPAVVTAVTPGVTLDLGIDASRLGTGPGKIDPASVRIMTRENPGDPWTALPSFYDKTTGKVRGESDHLSQFVVIGTPFVPPAGPKVVLDPDDDVANTTGPNGPMTELPQNVRLANELKTMMANTCRADVLVTRPVASPAYISPATRAAMAAAHHPDLTVTLAFDALYGHPWGVSVDGGTKAYSRGGADDNAVTASLVAQMPGYTGRPATTASMSGTGTALPYPELGSLPGAVTHVETLYIDHNFDRPVIDNGFSSITNGVFTGLGKYLQSKGFNCLNPVTGGWPTRPSAAELAKWRTLGFHNYQAYGAEPVSFTTGNLIEKFPIFSLTGPANQDLELSLIYNSQDGRLSRAGAGVSFGAGARVQRFSDGSVLAVRGDGASYVFTGNGAGGYTAEPGTLNTLTEAGSGQLHLASPDGQSWDFNAAGVEGIGELIKHTDRQGNATTLAYGPAAATTQFLPLASITDAAGQTVKVSTDALGRITGFTHPDGRVWGLAYDGNGNLVSITEPDGRTRVLAYDGNHQLVTATDPTGVTYLRNEYDGAGRVVKQWDAQGNVRTFAYDDAAKTTTYTDNEGHQSIYARDDSYRVVQITDAAGGRQSFTYDAHGQVTGYTDANANTTSYSYDAGGRLTRTTAPENTVTSFTYTPAGDLASQTDNGGAGNGGAGGTPRTTSIDNDNRGLPVTVHRPDGSTLTATYGPSGDLASSTDGAGNTSTYTHDRRGNLLTATDPDGNTTRYAYDAANRVTSSTDPNGNVTKYAWDSADRLVTRTDAAGGVTKLAYDGNNHLTTATDPTGAVTKYEWDALFRVTSVTAPDGGKTSYTYNREDKLTKTTNPLGAVTVFDLDPLYRVVKTTDPLGGTWTRSWDRTGNQLTSTDPENATTTRSYDKLGRLTSVTDPTGATTSYTLDGVGRTTTVTDPSGAEWKTQYTLLDQVAAVTDPTGKTTAYTYDPAGNRTAVTDRRGQAWKSSFDKAGRLTGTTDPTGATTGYGYDPNGNTTTVTDPLKRTTTTVFDALNRPVAVTNPAGETSKTSYDPDSRVTAMTDPAGAAWTRAYDPAGRLTRTVDPDGVTTSYGWDLAGNQTSTTDTKGTLTAYAWDPAQQLTAVTENARAGQPEGPAVNVTTAYTHSPAGYLAMVKDPNGNTTSYAHDKNGHTTAETNPLGHTTTYAYDPRGLLASRTDPNGATATNTYTPRGDLAQITYSTGAGTNSTTSYGYDGEQALITMSDSAGASNWQYDARGSVTSATDAQGKTLSYGYDAAGELTTLTLPAGSTSPATTGASAGKPTAGAPAAVGYAYDPAGRVSKQTSPWGDAAYTYTPAGQTATITRTGGITTTTAYTAAGRTKTITDTTPKPDPAIAAAAATATTGASAGSASATPANQGPLSQDAKACTTAASYLASRTLPQTGATGINCLKTAEYLGQRTLPSTEAGITAGEALTLDYSYDANGNVATRTRTNGTPKAAPDTESGPGFPAPPVPVPNTGPSNPATGAVAGTTDKRSYSYDPLNRLTASTSSTGVTNSYGYDPNGNRTRWATSDNPSTTVTGDELDVTAAFNSANQLTSETRTGSGPGVAGTTSYSYDANGNRTRSSVPGGPDITYSYTPENQTASITRNGITSTYTYDGLGRNLTSTDTTTYGKHQTSTVYNGLTPVQNTDNQGTANLIPGNTGQPTLQTGTATIGDRWNLTDKLGSTIAQTTTATGAGTGPAAGAAGTGAGASISQLSDYSDFGVQQYGTTGWDADPNYTAQPTNATHGTSQFHARTLDPETGTWTAQDPWHGLLKQPQTLSRYAYTLNNPATLTDYMGYWPWDDIGRFVSDTVNNINNAVNTAMTNFNSWIHPDTRPVGHLATANETSAAPVDIAQVNKGGLSPGNNATSGTPAAPVKQNWDQRPQLFFNYWSTFVPWGRVANVGAKVLRPVVQWLAKIAGPLRHVEETAEIGGAASVRLGQAGEAAVQAKYAIGDKATRFIDGRTRIFDGLTSQAVSEVKNVSYQAYTQQLKDSLTYAQRNGLRFDLYVRPTTTLSQPLLDAIARREINLRYIP
ncbi:putative toxin [Arthrobacter bambusae]|uniref:RHS repeat-associated protein n=1 Tax=Arthrobacter bambusae TaxID=1338426 RepID=A0AAW8D9G2_9MICC|nr:putative toxin [Arthrobacter bambusae]MDP9903103.1 RHS repeat-associated protein [Arthrobacter bambusae]MDQ0128903.1 RHS repeat-associated protein [Arthrobacter bambusae]MDQ0180244.1 RHS repeat-associated protein [Arthrobacter bambusae]